MPLTNKQKAVLIVGIIILLWVLFVDPMRLKPANQDVKYQKEAVEYCNSFNENSCEENNFVKDSTIIMCYWKENENTCTAGVSFT